MQDIPLERVPKLSENGVEVRLYSGSLAGLTSPIQNYTPMIVADITIKPGATTIQEVPANYNTFLYVINGSVKVGDEEKLLNQDQVGWLDIFADTNQSELKLIAGEKGVRFVLYAGKPLGENIISHGPFIADSSEDINRLYQEYRQGKMRHISTVPADQRIAL